MHDKTIKFQYQIDSSKRLSFRKFFYKKLVEDRRGDFWIFTVLSEKASEEIEKSLNLANRQFPWLQKLWTITGQSILKISLVDESNFIMREQLFINCSDRFSQREEG